MRSYDYVEDNGGTVYVLRAYVESDDSAILYPAYQRTSSGLRRIWHTGAHRSAASAADWLVDAGCVIRSRETVCVAQPWNSSPLSSDGPDLDKGFREFVALAEESGAKLYAYGSRLLGKEGPGSDWDVLIEGLSDPFRLVAQVVQQIPAARYRTDGELASLFTLPRQNVPISATDLVSILRDGLPYFYIRDFPVDLMKAGPAQVPVIPDLEREDIDIVGTIVGDAVDAYSMPRRLSLALGSGEIVSVFFLTWFLQGLGRRIGQKVTFQALRRDRQGKLWFASRFSKITLL